MDSDSYTLLLKDCIHRKSLIQGRLLHGRIIKYGYNRGTFLANHILEMYAMCRSLMDARQLFDKMPDRDEHTWNRMIAGYTQCRRLEDARQMLDEMPQRSEVSWNTLIAGYSRYGDAEEALETFCQMQRSGIMPNQYSFASVLSACSRLAHEQEGKQIHAGVIRRGFEANVFVGSSLVDLYGKCAKIDDARRVFDGMRDRDEGMWSAMIAGHARHGHSEEALKLFLDMLRSGMNSSQFSFTSILSVCANLRDLECGRSLHGYIVRTGLDTNVFVGNSLVDMYGKCVSMEDAHKVFDEMSKHDEVSWNAMIGAYAQNGDGVEALKWFCQMEGGDIKPDDFTLASVLSACASLAAVQHGKHIHSNIVKTGYGFDVYVSSALIDMYAKCGSIEDARHVFDEMPKQDVVSWSAMIGGYAQNGCAKEALKLFELLLGTNVKPNHVTFVGILSACSHAGLVDVGFHNFYSMIQDHCITPQADHYGCMIDLLGRAGRLDEATDLINNMPFKPNAVIWGVLLGACRIHGNFEVGQVAAEHLLKLEPDNSSTYVLLSNIYAAAGKWDDAAKVRKLMKSRGIRKVPGYSWIEVKNKVHVFVADDNSHPQTAEIYMTLERLTEQIKEVGYVPDTNFVLHNLEEEHKEHILSYHSEKLAIAFGIINTSPRIPIRIVKNLRVCGDCHNAIKFISEVSEREIILRDVSRFHHFRNGLCSCGNYW
ncbi:hypothetical protein KI387_039276 [Taxus chinensis]|uniref:DYW domain-containing protein n=1 Tax=Taxus chinensis TaxID=29808 RepID=A0AA38FAR3_TAXCH|nr:hypothetical protein KI387_039276 [Taxus chinensis]